MTWSNWHLFMPPGALFFAGCMAAVSVSLLMIMCLYAWKSRRLKRKAANYARMNGLQDLSELLRLGIPELMHSLAERVRKSEKKAEMGIYTDLLIQAWYAKDGVSAYWEMSRWILFVLGAILLVILVRTAYVLVTYRF